MSLTSVKSALNTFMKLSSKPIESNGSLLNWQTPFSHDIILTDEAKLESLSSDAKTIALYRAREAALHKRANMINSAKAEGIRLKSKAA
jgi:hypothetical protein